MFMCVVVLMFCVVGAEMCCVCGARVFVFCAGVFRAVAFICLVSDACCTWVVPFLLFMRGVQEVRFLCSVQAVHEMCRFLALCHCHSRVCFFDVIVECLRGSLFLLCLFGIRIWVCLLVSRIGSCTLLLLN